MVAPYGLRRPPDKIYALLGLQPTIELKPDYTITVRTLFIRSAIAAVMAGHVYTMISMAAAQPSQGLPSWVPDFDLSIGASSNDKISNTKVNDDGSLSCTIENGNEIMCTGMELVARSDLKAGGSTSQFWRSILYSTRAGDTSAGLKEGDILVGRAYATKWTVSRPLKRKPRHTTKGKPYEVAGVFEVSKAPGVALDIDGYSREITIVYPTALHYHLASSRTVSRWTTLPGNDSWSPLADETILIEVAAACLELLDV